MLPRRTFLSSLVILLFVGCLFSLGRAKLFERCDFARELLRLGVAQDELSTWVCIAQRESNLNTSAVGKTNGDGSGDHGVFQISDRYWCSPQGWACNIPCSLLEDDDITDDWRCARRIFKQHRLLSGNGWDAWAVYKPYCAENTEAYIDGCFTPDGTSTTSEVSSTSSEPPSKALSSTSTTTSKTEEEEVVSLVQSYSAREGNNAEKIQVLDLEMMEKTQDTRKTKSLFKTMRLWKPWTWDF